VAWGTKKHPHTDTSTAQAEYTTIHHALREISFVRAFYTHIFDVMNPAIIYEDNSSALSIANGTETSFSRFLLTKYFAVRQAVMAGEIEVRKVATANQLANIMTKALEKTKFLFIRDFILESLSLSSPV